MRNFEKVVQEEGIRGLYRGKQSEQAQLIILYLIKFDTKLYYLSILCNAHLINSDANIKSLLINYRLFSISILHSPVPHDLLSPL